MSAPRRWDVFCNVVDNYGDAGVAWRLARILAAEHALDVTLWIDALAPLARMAPAIAADRALQRVDGVTVRRLDDMPSAWVPADVVVEAFVGGLPERYVTAMAARAPAPRWLRLEYLAPEPQADALHGLASPHPRLGLARRFWFPGFSPHTGGLLRERGLFAARDEFRTNANAQDALWSSIGLEPPLGDERRVSMFCYEDAPVDTLLRAWSRGRAPVTCIVPEGIATDAVARVLRAAPRNRGETPFVDGCLTVIRVPFVAQDVYDRMLWACDVNFVRGEDSFVRAQWAAKPFVWQAYAQPERAHAAKISAFVERYVTGLATSTAAAVQGLFRAWNRLPGAPPLDAAWSAYERELDALRAHGTRWCELLAALPELASALVKAAENKL